MLVFSAYKKLKMIKNILETILLKNLIFFKFVWKCFYIVSKNFITVHSVGEKTKTRKNFSWNLLKFSNFTLRTVLTSKIQKIGLQLLLYNYLIFDEFVWLTLTRLETTKLRLMNGIALKKWEPADVQLQMEI